MNTNKLKSAIPAQILRESNDMDQYADDFQKALEVKHKNRPFMGWTLSIDRYAGTFEWNKKGSDTVVMATPFFDGQENLPIDIFDGEGDSLLSKVIKWKPTRNMKKDEEQYFKLLKPFLQNIR